MIKDLYTYLATVNRIIDGDTAIMSIDLGFTISWMSPCRFHGINAPEINAKDADTRLKAIESKQAVMDHLGVGQKVKIVSRELDKYGRPIVDVYCGDKMDLHLNQWLLDNGLAKEYNP